MAEEKNIMITAEETDRLLGAADGLSALLFLYLRRYHTYAPSKAARELNCNETDIVLAANKLRRLGLLEPLQNPHVEEQETPEYTIEDIIRRAAEDKSFSGLRYEAEQMLGKTLNTNDLRLLLGLYDHLGLPAEVIVMLLHHCVETYQERNGAGRIPTMRYIEKEGWFWAEHEILSLEAAEEHIDIEKRKQEIVEQIKPVLQIRGRDLSVSERRFVENWISLGYGPETLAVAYDRTVLATGRLVWRYMDRIIQSWNEKKLFTIEEITAGDSRNAPAHVIDSGKEFSDSEKVARMRKMADHLKNKEG